MACSVYPMYLLAYVQSSIISKVVWASAVLSGRWLNNWGGRATTFCEELRASFGGWPGSSLTVMSPPTFSSISSPSLSFLTTGERDWLRDFAADKDTPFVAAVVVGLDSECDSGPLPEGSSPAGPLLTAGASAELSRSSFILVTASATASGLTSALSWADMTRRTAREDYLSAGEAGCWTEEVEVEGEERVRLTNDVWVGCEAPRKVRDSEGEGRSSASPACAAEQQPTRPNQHSTEISSRQRLDRDAAVDNAAPVVDRLVMREQQREK